MFFILVRLPFSLAPRRSLPNSGIKCNNVSEYKKKLDWTINYQQLPRRVNDETIEELVDTTYWRPENGN